LLCVVVVSSNLLGFFFVSLWQFQRRQGQLTLYTTITQLDAIFRIKKGPTHIHFITSHIYVKVISV
jgi:hypothetical protein